MWRIALILVIAHHRIIAMPAVEPLRNASAACETVACASAAHQIRHRMNVNVDPCVDFYEFACGRFLNETMIPRDKPMLIPAIMDIMDKVNAELLRLIEEPITTTDPKPVRMAKKYYADCMDRESRQLLGSAPLLALIDRIGGWPLLNGLEGGENIREWWEISAAFAAAGVKADHLVGIRVVEDMKNPRNRSIYLTPPGFTDSFELRHLLFSDPLAKLMEGIAKELHAVDGAQILVDMRALEQFFVDLNAIKGPVEEFLPLQMYNPCTLADMQQKYPYLNWVAYINAVLPQSIRVAPSERVVIIWPDYMEQLKHLLEKTDRRTIANFLGWKVIEESVSLLDARFSSLYQSLSAAIVGNSEASPAWEMCLQTTKQNIPVVMDALYVRRHRNPESRMSIDQLVLRVREKMSTNLWSQVQWMDAVTKQRAQRKINAIRQVIAYPDELLSEDKLEQMYEGIDIDGLSFFDATFKLKNFTANRMLLKLRKPLDATLDWTVLSMSSEVNAFFDPIKNIIVIPAATIQGHLFDVDRPNYLNYAAIGTIIGHEINHGFDMAGRLFDDSGNLTDWWEPETATHFQERATCLEEQYTKYVEPITRTALNSAFTQSEDISDNGGVHLLYKTYAQWVAEHEPEAGLPGLPYSPEQLFWIYYGQTWCGKARPEYMALGRLMDPHSPLRFRVLGPLSNSESFAKDFNCPSGAAMNPDKKCNLW